MWNRLYSQLSDKVNEGNPGTRIDAADCARVVRCLFDLIVVNPMEALAIFHRGCELAADRKENEK